MERRIQRRREFSPPLIRLDAISSGTASVFAFVLGNDLEILDDIEITGDGTQDLIITGSIAEYLPGRSITKTGTSTLELTGQTAIAGSFRIDEGVVTLTGAGMSAETVSVGAVAEATLIVQSDGFVSTPNFIAGSEGTVSTNAFCAGSSSCATGIHCDALTIEVGQQTWGSVTVIGEALLGGTLNVVLTGPCAPPVGATLDVLTASTVTGSFDTVNVPANLEISHLPTAVRLTVVAPTLPGDATCDGVVGVDDLLALLGTWGSCPAPCPPSCPADFDGDCEVNVIDLLELLARWTCCCCWGSSVLALAAAGQTGTTMAWSASPIC